MSITVCLLNYRRPKNLEQVIAALLQQTVRPNLFLWDNGEIPPANVGYMDWLVTSRENKFCLPRWWMAARAETTYVCSLDDDMLPKDENVLADAIAAHEGLNTGRSAIGPYGVLFTEPEYEACDHLSPHDVTPPYDGQPVDMIKGRFLLARTDDIKKMPLLDSYINEDDIGLCGLLADGKPARHHIPRILKDRFEELPAPHAWSRRPEHVQSRNMARKRFFPTSLPRFEYATA